MSEYKSMGKEFEAEIKEAQKDLWIKSDNELMALTMSGVAYKFFRAGVKWFKEKKSKEKQLSNALLAVETICMHDNSENHTIAKIYRMVHVARGTCKNPHEDWKAELEEMVEIAEDDT